MRRRGHPTKRRVPAELSTPVEEHIDESVNVPIPPPIPSEPSDARPSHPPEPAGVNIPYCFQPLPLTTENPCEAKPYCLLKPRIKIFFYFFQLRIW